MTSVRIRRSMRRKDGNAKATISSSLKVTPTGYTISKKIIPNVSTK